MDYREFTDAVEKQINRKMTGDVHAGLYTAVKNNGKERTRVLIETPGINISPTIYLEEYYAEYQAGTSFEKIVDEIIEFYECIRRDRSWDYEKILSFEGVKDKIVFKLINTEKNSSYLNRVPHLAFLDLSIVFYVLLDVTKEGSAAMVITNSHVKQWGVETDKLWEAAVINVKKLLPAEFFTMNYALKEMMGRRVNASGVIDKENLFLGDANARDGMYVLSNRIRNYGAACIAYPHILEMVGQILCRDFYVLPSSVHEVVIVPCFPGMDCHEMDEMVRDINDTEVAAEEVLGDHVYLYERSSGMLRMATNRRVSSLVM